MSQEVQGHQDDVLGVSGCGFESWVMQYEAFVLELGPGPGLTSTELLPQFDHSVSLVKVKISVLLDSCLFIY